MPFQSNTYFSSGPLEKTGNVVIIQPIVPIKLTRDWNLITRWVTRVVYVPRRSAADGSAFGLGNLQPEFYFSPAHTGTVIWGVGQKLYLLTATSDELGINRIGGGLCRCRRSDQRAVDHRHHRPQRLGRVGSRTRRSDDAQSFRLLQRQGWLLIRLIQYPVITSNWAATSSGRWTVPLGGGIGRLFNIFWQAACERAHSGFAQRGATGLRAQLAAASPGAVPFLEALERG